MNFHSLSSFFIKRNSVTNLPQDTSLALSLIVLGVVFGDIGTSPLYSLRECFAGSHILIRSSDNILGVVSLIFWTLLLIVSVKYIFIVMRADNEGEGGILALMALVNKVKKGINKQHFSYIIILGILGAALLCGDAVITPAISIMSAIEGLSIATPIFNPFLVPLSITILIVLFWIQSQGTAKIGSLFGPIMLVWFTVIGLLGLISIIKYPAILTAINPAFAVKFLINNGFHGFPTLGSVFLAVTGTEVLYADLGHFGRKPIQFSWVYIVFPALFLNYFGQGAYLLSSSQSIDNLFYRIAPLWFLYPLIALATAATVIASQAVISGVFSLAKQSVQLGFWPRIQIRHTSIQKIGQVYVPFINWCLLIGTILLVLGFRESGKLAGAYGIAVSGTMLITTILVILVARYVWSIHLYFLIPMAVIFLIIDLSFFLSNVAKIMTGGWIVLVISATIYLLIKTWIDSRKILSYSLVELSVPLDVLLQNRNNFEITPVSGTAVFLSANPDTIPAALLHNLKHNKVLHEKTIILSVRIEDIPYVQMSNRAQVDFLGKGFYRIILHYGFSETPDIPAALNAIEFPDLKFDINNTTFFLGRKSILVTHHGTMPVWRKKIYNFMSRSALDIDTYFNLPSNRIVEMGTRLEL